MLGAKSTQYPELQISVNGKRPGDTSKSTRSQILIKVNWDKLDSTIYMYITYPDGGGLDILKYPIFDIS